jgi:hypothetical protein
MHWHMHSVNNDATISLLNAIIVLSDQGGKEVRCRFGQNGCCALVTEIIKWHRLRNINAEALEYACTAVYQLILGSYENRFLLRQSGIDKELYCLSQYAYFLPTLQQEMMKERAEKLLRILKDQVSSLTNVFSFHELLTSCLFVVIERFIARRRGKINYFA